MERKVYKSRISILVLAFYTILILACLVPVFFMPRYGVPIVVIIIYLVIILASFIICCYSFWHFHYTLIDGFLHIGYTGKAWKRLYSPDRYEVMIPLSKMVSVERSYSLCVIGFSHKALRISFKRGYRCPGEIVAMSWPYAKITPASEEEFLTELLSRNPAINIAIEPNVPEKTRWWRLWDWEIYKINNNSLKIK